MGEARETKRRIAHAAAMKALKKQGENADKAAKARVAKTGAALKAAEEETEKEKANGEAISEKMQKNAKKLQKSHDAEEQKYKDDIAANAKKAKRRKRGG